MTLSDQELEKLEKDYFDQIRFNITRDRAKMVNFLTSMYRIRDDWLDRFRAISRRREASDMAAGVERVFFSLLAGIGNPMSAPIGSDMFFETHNAYIHIELKTARESNESDFVGLVPLGKNQTSYKATQSYIGTPIRTEPNLPAYYSDGKPCLTYTIQVIYDHTTFEIIAVLLICIPNNQLYSVYGNDIAKAGKRKDESFRYAYCERPRFELLHEQPLRLDFLYFNDSYCETHPYFTKSYITKDIVT